MAIELPQLSRFRATPVFNLNGAATFGIYRQQSIRLDGDEQHITVKETEAGELDHVAFRFYNTRDLWWAIALVNGIADVTREVTAGQVLVIPKLNRILEALAEDER